MKKVLAGILIGFVVSLGAASYASEIQQYILTKAAYPIVVNGAEYQDTERPILNYEGSTYVPLAKLADLTGVSYIWNDELKRVEISTGPARFYAEYSKDIPSFAYVNGIPEGKRVELSDGKTIMYVYDATDATDGSIQKYAQALEEQGYRFESDVSDSEVAFYSKGDIVVGLTVMGYDFNVFITKD